MVALCRGHRGVTWVLTLAACGCVRSTEDRITQLGENGAGAERAWQQLLLSGREQTRRLAEVLRDSSCERRTRIWFAASFNSYGSGTSW